MGLITLSHVFSYGFLLFLISLSIYYWLTFLRPFARKFNKIGGPPILPFIGTLHTVILPSKIYHNFEDMLRKYEKHARFWFGHVPYLITSDVQTIEAVLSNPKHIEKPEIYSLSAPVIGAGGLINGPGWKWKRDRREMLPCMKVSMFHEYVGVYNKNAEILCQKLLGVASEGKAQDIREHFGRCIMDIVFESLFDIKFNLQRRPETRYFEAFNTLMELAGKQILGLWTRLIYSLIYGRAHKEYKKILRIPFNEETIAAKMAEQRHQISQTEFGKKRLCDILYSSFNDPHDVNNQFLTVMVGAFDTTATVLSHVCYHLALHPDIQSKMREEVTDILRSGDPAADTDGVQEYEKLSQMRYTELVIKESMRMLSPTDVLVRVLGEDLELANGVQVPKGANVLILPLHVHHDETVWPEPKKFIPERFLPENSAGRSPYAFLPFSGGPRGCFGPKFGMLAMKAIMARVLMNFAIETNKVWDEGDIRYDIVTHIAGGLPVILRPFRNNNNRG